MPNLWTLFNRWLRLRRRLWRRARAEAARFPTAEAPLRSQLLSTEQLELHGQSLARTHRTRVGRRPALLLERLRENEELLADACTLLSAMVTDEVRITPAGEWLLDNSYLIEDHIRLARRHLPKGYTRELPALSAGPSTDLPRVYDLAMEAIARGDGRIDAETISCFVAAYQSVTPLTLGELWAIPIMLRLALIENLRRVAVGVLRDGVDHRLAVEWAGVLNATAEHTPRNVVLVVADMARSGPPQSGAFVAELARLLHGRSALLAMPMGWIEHWLAEDGHTVEGLVHAESQQQAADQVSVSNSIGSLRFLAHMDWREFVETMSTVETVLRMDPAGTYAQMDFRTRDNYRHAVEQIARRCGADEIEVARSVLALARGHADDHQVESHVGYYLVDEGLPQVGAALAAAGIGKPRPLRIRRVGLGRYLLPIALVTAVFASGLIGELRWNELPSAALIGLMLLALLAFSELGIAIINWAATIVFAPRPLPRLDYSKGIPPASRTLVVVPTMLSRIEAVDTLVEALEVRFLANRDPQLHFALLTDFLDAANEAMPGDEALLDHATARIEQLNRRYAPERNDLFFLLQRPRRWNSAESCWMGYERKRGKLAALNRLLRGRAGAGADFMRIVGQTAVLANVRYVITLDSDTRLPRDAAREFVGTLAHPLNHARFDPGLRRVTRGYGILQPSVGSSMSGGVASRYASMFGSEPGIDPYTRTISDVYQDLFGEGSFVGKGIYDVDAFESALQDRFPENRILSHDLLEGCYARAGLVSDVRLFEDHPARYAADVKRRHRWIRGDWQLLPWLLPWAPAAAGGIARNPLSWLSRGKLLDNLRRSLVPTATLALLIVGWVLIEQPLRWTLWLLAPLLLPLLLRALWDTLTRPPDMPFVSHVAQLGRSLLRQLGKAATQLACLPYEAVFSLDAIARTLWRMAVSRRSLLQWSPSSEVELRLGPGGSAELRSMLSAPAIVVAIAALLGWRNPAALWVAAPLLALWFASPALMAWLGRPAVQRRSQLSPAQLEFLGRLARRTWAFFETQIRAQDHWLPPDNVQEHPALVVARRTSPTNIGLSLLANLAAYDLGYLQVGGLIERSDRALATLESLPRHRGHFYNWYDTETLQPLPPRYVSTVDSGNLAGHLLTLRQGLLALIDAPLLGPHSFRGLSDTLGVLEQHWHKLATAGAAHDPLLSELRQRIVLLCADPPTTLADAFDALQSLLPAARALQVAGAELAPRLPAQPHWPDAMRAACETACDELLQFCPGLAQQRGVETAVGIPSLRQLSVQDADAVVNQRARERIRALERLAHIAGQLSLMEYEFLYDRAVHLLAIGYNVDERRLDPGHYDLLASEARLGSFVGIAQGQLPQQTWFALGRLLTEIDGQATLLSWSGSMFEYLMPQLVMPSYPDTLLDQSMQHAVQAQIDYGRRRGVPWGISESGYNTVDARMNYQYRAFGVPGLGMKRGLGEDLVVAPYASMMALMVAPEAACRNLERLTELGFDGGFGLYEAIDYTPSRLPIGSEHAVVRSFMAHHQGMGLLALDYLLRDQPMQKRFVADPEFQATLLLLQERLPRIGLIHPHEAEAIGPRSAPTTSETRLRVFRDPASARPEVQMLSNGRYHVLLSSAGGGYSRQRDMAVTRWREDGTRDHWGSFCYLRDLESAEVWSAAHQPTCVAVEQYEAIFSDAKAEFRGRKRGFETHLEIAISAEDDIELRRLRITNRSRHARHVEITTYAEVVLAPAIADELHPAFSNLFVQSELVRDKQALLCTRRARSQHETPPWMLHLLAVHDADIDAISYETDRARFLGRGNTPRSPRAMSTTEPLSDTSGSVLDPIVAIRCRVLLKPEQTAMFDMVFGIGATRADCSVLIDKYRDRRLADRVFDLAWTHSQVVRRQINASQADAQLYERMARMVVYAHPQLRADTTVLLQNRRGQSGLWGYAISGDLPIVLVRIASAANIELVRQLVRAHAYWRLKGLHVDLVIWNEDQAGYRQHLQEQILGLISAGPEANVLDRPGGVFVRPAPQISTEDGILLQTVARMILSDDRGSLAAQVARLAPPVRGLPPLLEGTAAATIASPASPMPAPGPSLQDPAARPAPADAVATRFDNGTGGFSSDGREYLIVLEPGATTPAPWCNVMANAQIGSVVSESAPGYTWFENAHEFRLTPWHNDPVADSGGEAFYLRDEDSGQVWSPMPLPCRGHGSYRTRHGFGYSVYEHVEDGIASELTVFVALHQAVKLSWLSVRNLSGRPRRLSATGYVEWVLGDIRSRSHMHVVTELDPASGVLTARNPYNTEFTGRVAFFDADGSSRSITCDRLEFLGHNGSLAAPEAMRRRHLSARVGAGLDPCTAIQLRFDLAPEQLFETVFRLGIGSDHTSALQLAHQTRGVGHARTELDAVRAWWRETLGAVQVSTPDASVDVLVNGWLPYQTLACRYVARSGYYQSGGAFGFRDQLQDTMALVHVTPALAREHLLLCAARQFPQGDVQHWWHPPHGRGVRTRCSDDYLWLPLAVCRYLQVTADHAVLDEPVGFIDGRLLNPDEESYYDLPLASTLVQPLYDHCVLALRRGTELLGERGLPLIGSGDWNDGMNRVGDAGRGESVWLGFFLHHVLLGFAEVAGMRGDAEFAGYCKATAQGMRDNLETHAWDGEWYRRAWFDDGTPLGSIHSDECRIDSISQSWSVLSGAADSARAAQAMNSLDRHLVKREAGLIQLLDPPFDSTPKDPGYIRGYVPGVRENGGQYTHAAVWAAMAFAQLGDGARAWELARMINPVNHALDASATARYKVEPYVLAADVYGVAPHVGRGGWTWYTGSAGWMYRLLTESLLGLDRRGDSLRLTPCIPSGWIGHAIRYRFGSTTYAIDVTQVDAGPAVLRVDGVEQQTLVVALADDGIEHRVELRWPRPS